MTAQNTVRVRSYDYSLIETIRKETGLPQHEAVHLLHCLTGRIGLDRLVQDLRVGMNRYVAANSSDDVTEHDVTSEMRSEASPDYAEDIAGRMRFCADMTEPVDDT